ncbi:unnamed protein product, partial [Tetraodon nigroviridis]
HFYPHSHCDGRPVGELHTGVLTGTYTYFGFTDMMLLSNNSFSSQQRILVAIINNWDYK